MNFIWHEYLMIGQIIMMNLNEKFQNSKRTLFSSYFSHHMQQIWLFLRRSIDSIHSYFVEHDGCLWLIILLKSMSTHYHKNDRCLTFPNETQVVSFLCSDRCYFWFTVNCTRLFNDFSNAKFMERSNWLRTFLFACSVKDPD